MKNCLFGSSKLLPLILLLVLLNNVSLAQTGIATEIPVSYDVSSTGSFSYSLPIRIPPGIKEMVPQFSINYSSQGGNGGLMGVGWNMAGASIITRSNTTLHHNGVLDAVDFDLNDNFSLDGQILIPTGQGSGYVVYNTWIKNYAKIIGHWPSGTHPQSFTVEYPNGIIYEYGNTTNSKMLAKGKTDILMWAVSKIYDRSGNYIEFEYYNNQLTGEYRVTKIKYTGNSAAALLPQSEIIFNYLTKADQNRSWVSGSEVIDNVMLDNISIYHGGALVNKYDFTYNSNHYLRLAKIIETRGGVALPEININWGATPTQHSVQTTNHYGSGYATFAVGDINGDGATDYINTPTAPPATFAGYEVYKNNKNNTFTVSTPVPLGFSDGDVSAMTLGNGNRLVVDFNGDGYDDVLLMRVHHSPNNDHSEYKIFAYISDGNTLGSGVEIFSFLNQEPGNAPFYINNVRLEIGDFDGNGKKDLLVFTPSALISGSGGAQWGRTFDIRIVGDDYYTSVGEASGIHGSIYPGNSKYVGQIQHGIYNSASGDFDGDGKTDLIITNDNSGNSAPPYDDCEMFTLNITYTPSVQGLTPSVPGSPTSVLVPMMQSNFPSYHHTQLRVGDFNGDGKDDLLTAVPSAYYGAGLPDPVIWDLAYSTGYFPGTYSLLSFAWGGGSTTWFGMHTGLPPNMNSVFDGHELNNPITTSVHVADFNGDGKDDILKLFDPTSTSSRDRTYHMFYSKGFDNFDYKTGTLNNFSSRAFEVIPGDFNGDGQADLLCHMQGSTAFQPTIAYFDENDMRGVVTSIQHANKTINVNYKSLAQKSDYTYEPIIGTTAGRDPGYPNFSKQLPIKVVDEVYDGISIHTTYRYRTLVGNFFGLGFKGFLNIDITDIPKNKLTEVQYCPSNDFSIQYPFRTLYWDLSIYNDVKNGIKPPHPMTLPLTETIILGQDMDGGNNGEVRNISLANKEHWNYTTGIYEFTSNTYNNTPGGMFYEFGQPDVTEIYKGYSGEEHTVINYTYDPGAAFYNKSKPIATTTSITRNGKPTHTRNAEFQYNSLGLVAQSKADPGTSNEKTTTYTYDALFGNLVSTSLTAASGIVGSITDNITYSTDGRFIEEKTNTLNYKNTYSYNVWGAMLSHTNMNAQTTTYQYDVLNRITSATNHLGITSTTTYDWANSQPDIPSGLNAQFVTTSSTTGISGSDISIIDIYGRKLRGVTYGFSGTKLYTDIRYLGNGLVDYTTLPYNSSFPATAIKNENTYDEADRLIQSVNSASGLTIRYSYNLTSVPGNIQNLSGLETTVQNMNTGQQKVYYTDELGMQWKIDDNGNVIEYDFNSMKKPDMMKVDNTFITTYQYDPFGNVKEVVEPNAGTTKYDYNALGLVTKKDENTKVFFYEYDKLDRLIKSTEPAVATQYTYTYGNTPNVSTTGKLLSNTSPHGTSHSYNYNALGQLSSLVQTIGAQSFTSSYTYDNYERLVTHQYPTTDKIQNNYNSYGYHESIDLTFSASGAPTHRLWQMNAQNSLGLTTRTSYFNTSNNAIYQFNKAYDALGFPTSRKVTNIPNVTSISDFRYSFDNITGNLNYREDFNRSMREDFTYDAVFDRLTNVTNNIPGSNPLVMEYNNIGNILHKSDVSDPLSATPSVPKFDWIYNDYALTKLQSPQTSNPPYVIPKDLQQVWYYPFNKIQKVSENGNNEEFTYWPNEQRALMESKDYNGNSLRKRYYAAMYEKTIDGTTGDIDEVCYVFGDGEPVAFINHKTNSGGTVTSSIYYPITDHLGSITHILDNLGIVNNGLLEERSFDAWGRYRNPVNWQCYTTTPSLMFDRGYTGHEHIGQYNIINMNGRLYDPLTARMYSPDPFVPDNTNSQAYNRYSYVGNNPLKYSDPTGHFWHIIVGAAVGGFANVISQNEKGNINTMGDWFKSFHVGALAGSAGAMIGGVVGGVMAGVGFGGSFAAGAGSTAGFWSGAWVGAVGAGTSGAVLGFGNTWNRGGSFDESVKAGYIGGTIGSFSGAVSGGLIGGVSSAIEGRNFWSGNSKEMAALKKIIRRSFPDNKPVDPQTVNKFYNDNFGDLALEFKHGMPRLKLGDANGNVATTIPDSYTEASRSTIILGPKALQGEKNLYFTIYHELSHAELFDNGMFAAMNNAYGRTFAVSYSEFHAYMDGVSVGYAWGDSALIDWCFEKVKVYLKIMYKTAR